jgi:conjugal transfer pilus assembly protein TraB
VDLQRRRRREAADADGAEKVEVSTKDLVNRNLSQQEWMALSENRFESTENQLKSVNGQQARMDNLAAQIEALKGQNSSMQADGQRVLSAYQAENEQLRKQLNERPSAPPPRRAQRHCTGGRPASLSAAGRAGRGRRSASAQPRRRGQDGQLLVFRDRECVKVAKGSTVYTDSPNYLPPNSFASAKVIVGVDASAGVNSQTDPLPVVLRVTGPARSVPERRLLTTKIEGCLINGAARGDLSARRSTSSCRR